MSKSSKLRVGLIIPDVHIPYHDKRAWKLVLEVAKALKLDFIRVLGDFCDFYSVSSHSKDPNRTRFLDDEIHVANRCLNELDALGATDKQFCGGNHEYRLERYLQDKAPELFNMIRIPELLKLAQRGWEYIPYRQDKATGYVHFTHTVGPAGRQAAYKALDTFQHSVVTGDTHRMAYVVEGDATGTHKVSAQFGWLGDVNQIDYMHRVKARKDWALGFGVAYHDPKTRLVYLVPVPIVNYSCVVNGRLFRG